MREGPDAPRWPVSHGPFATHQDFPLTG